MLIEEEADSAADEPVDGIIHIIFCECDKKIKIKSTTFAPLALVEHCLLFVG